MESPKNENVDSENLYRLRGDLHGRLLLFDVRPGVISVGSAPQNDISLAFAGVSRHHALLQIGADGLVAEDLGSTNGTYIDGIRVVRAAAVEGSQLAFGPVELTLETLEEGAELAIRFEAAARDVETVADPVELTTGEGGALSNFEEMDTTFIDGEESVDPEWALMEDVARLLQTGDLSGLLSRLCDVLELEGVRLVRWARAGKPSELDRWGNPGLLPSLAEIRGWPALCDTHGDLWHCARLEGGVVTACHAPRPQGDGQTTGLLLSGAKIGPIPPHFLRILLRLCLWALPTPADPGAGHRVDDVQLRFPEGYVIGRSEEMKRLYRQMAAVCRLLQPVLLHGETGVGKEMLARALHDSSAVSKAPYVVVNCAAIPENLLEAEMFGVVKGAATGVEAREGYFSRAEGGTIFLDEIGELSPALQAKLLRVLQEGEIQPVGGTPRPIDVWVIAATHVDFESGALRRDLYYRLAAGLLEIPPLRRCRDDIPILTRHYLRLAAEKTGFDLRGVTSRALDKLRSYGWPGNIRELAHVVGRLVVDQPAGGVIDIEGLPEALRHSGPSDVPEESLSSSASLELKPRVEALERRLIREAMIRSAGHQIRAAELLGISRSGLAKKLKRLGLVDSWARPSTS